MNASSSLAKRAAAVAASGWTKLEVRKSASEFSPHALAGRPSRTASVSRRVPSGSFTRGMPPLLVIGAPSRRLGGALQREARARVVGVFLVALRRALRRHRLDLVGADVAGDVAAVEARRLEAVELGVERADDALHRRDVLVDQRVGADQLADLLDRAAVRDELVLGRHVDAVDVRIAHRWRRGR